MKAPFPATLWMAAIFIVPACVAQTADGFQYNEGRSLFRTNCAACHSVCKEMSGPQLSSITKKRTEEWLIPFIQNSQAAIAANDPYATALFGRYGRQVMPSFRQLQAGEIQNILRYIAIESQKPSDDIGAGLIADQQADPSVLHGEIIFQTQCAACHFLDHEGYGPALGSVTKRHSAGWLKAFIRNSQAVIGSGDPYAKHLFEQFDKRVMVTMDFLSEQEVEDVLRYIEYRASSDHATAGASGRKIQFGKMTSEIHLASPGPGLQGARFVGAFVVCLIAAGVLLYVFVVRRLFKYLQEEKSDVPEIKSFGPGC